MQYRMIVCIVPHDCGEEIVRTANQNGAAGGTILMGKGTASNGILQLLGLGDSWKDIVYILVEKEVEQNVRKAIIAGVSPKAHHFGVMFSENIGTFIKAGHKNQKTQGETDMNSQNEYEVINIIVNKGYAEDAMAAARKAGAGGGTVIAAKGTAKEGDAKFFGVDIVPEKDMLMILVPSEKKDAIISSIKELPCFSKEGSGIIFCNQAEDFTLLGK
ncbi:MAG: transcriptional regulator [Treponema sp.]|nr:transcriptional regulator [Treponema sp.]